MDFPVDELDPFLSVFLLGTKNVSERQQIEGIHGCACSNLTSLYEITSICESQSCNVVEEGRCSPLLFQNQTQRVQKWNKKCGDLRCNALMRRGLMDLQQLLCESERSKAIQNPRLIQKVGRCGHGNREFASWGTVCPTCGPKPPSCNFDKLPKQLARTENRSFAAMRRRRTVCIILSLTGPLNTSMLSQFIELNAHLRTSRSGNFESDCGVKK